MVSKRSRIEMSVGGAEKISLWKFEPSMDTYLFIYKLKFNIKIFIENNIHGINFICKV